MIIGITGTDGAGKGAAVDHLVRRHGFKHYSSRAEITAEIEARNLPVDRQTMRIVANDLRAEFGYDVLVKRALERMRTDEVTDAVIESIRTLGELETLRQNGGVLLAIDADVKKRYSRITGRRSQSDSVTFDEFVAHEKLEMSDPDPNGMQKAAVIEQADCIIMNNYSLRKLYSEIDDYLQQQATA